jgi:hypothetical protein
MTAKTGAERIKAYRQQREAQGLRDVHFWLTGAEKRQVQKFVERLIAKRPKP